MNYNENTLKQLSDLSDDKLQALIQDIGAAIGASPRKTEALTGDVDKVRKTLSTISEEDAKRLIDRAGKEKAARIYEAIQRSTR